MKIWSCLPKHKSLSLKNLLNYPTVFHLMTHSIVLDTDSLRQCLSDHGKGVIDILAEKQICLDGKKLKGVSPSSHGNRGLYIVNAWVSENRLCMGQKRVEDKSN